MKIEFQHNIDKQLMIDIVKLFHPSLDIDVIKNNIKYHRHGNYNWVMIGFRVKNYGYVSLGIDNHYSHKSLFGPINKQMVSELFKEKLIGYRIWRYADDLHCDDKSYIQDDSEHFSKRIPLPSQNEFYNYYMQD